MKKQYKEKFLFHWKKENRNFCNIKITMFQNEWENITNYYIV